MSHQAGAVHLQNGKVVAYLAYTLLEIRGSRRDALSLIGTTGRFLIIYGSENGGAKVRVKWSVAKAHLFFHPFPWGSSRNKVEAVITCSRMKETSVH